MQGSPLFTSTLARHTQKKMSLQCRGASTSITVGLPIIWWSRRLGHYWGRLENILNSAAFRSQWRHAPSYHDHNIVHHSGYCESSDWLSSRGSLARGSTLAPLASSPIACTINLDVAPVGSMSCCRASGIRDTLVAKREGAWKSSSNTGIANSAAPLRCEHLCRRCLCHRHNQSWIWVGA